MTRTHRVSLFPLLVALVLMIACLPVLAEDEVSSLAPWSGTWNSAESFLTDESVQQAFAAAAETMDAPAETVQAMYTAMMSADGTGSFVITDKEIAAYSGQNGEGDLLFRANFSYVGKETIQGEFQGMEFTMDWFKFALEGEGPEAYTYLVLAEMEREEGGMIHFHYRFGKDSFEALTGMTDAWYPTMCDSSVTAEMLLREFISGE